jgi:phosphotriesterase-related protein
LFSSSAEDLYETLYGECTLGVLVDDEHPKESQRSSSKANMLKMGLDHRGVTAVIERIMTAIGEVSRQTGIPCMIHTEPEVPFHEVVEALKQAEIPPERVIFCHMGKSFDLTLHEALAKDGYYIEFDEMVRPEPSLEILAQGILNLFAQGFGSSILFAGDLARRSYWNCYGGKPGLAYLLTGLENNLLSLGLSQAMLDQIWLNNPRELFL